MGIDESIIREKFCPRCKKNKALSEFGVDKARSDGLTYDCKECKNESNRKYRSKNKDKVKAYNKLYASTHPVQRIRQEPAISIDVSGIQDFEHVIDGCTCLGKACNWCKNTKCINAFALDKHLKSGRRNYCKVCHSTKVQQRRKEHGRKRYPYKPRSKPSKVYEIDYSVPGSKRCYRCDKVKDYSKFSKNRTRPDGYTKECKECRSEMGKTNKRKKFYFLPDHQTALKMMLIEDNSQGTQKIDLAALYKSILERQNGVCAICGQYETSRNQHTIKRLAIDHDHVTGAFRGLLCTRCNLAIGQFDDDPQLLLKAIGYLETTFRTQITWGEASNQPPGEGNS